MKYILIMILIMSTSGCAVLGAVPTVVEIIIAAPVFKVVNNAHTALTVKNNLDDDPDNNGFVMDVLNIQTGVEGEEINESDQAMD
jgi:hypothetical protein